MKCKFTGAFLTKADTVGMQWEVREGKRLLNTISVWTDHKGVLQSTHSAPVELDKLVGLIDYYHRFQSRYKQS